MIVSSLRGGVLKAFAWMLAPALLLGCASVSNAAMMLYSGGVTVDSNNPEYATESIAPVTQDFYFAYTMELTSGSLDALDQVQFYFDSDPSVMPGAMPWSFAPSVGLKVDQGGAGTSDFQARWGYTNQQYSGAKEAPGVGETVGIIAKLSKSGGTVYDTIELWVVDAFTGVPAFHALGAPQATSVTGSSSLTSVSTVGIFSAALDAGDSVFLDNVSLATVPEPMTMALWGMGGIAGLAYSARRRKLAAKDTEAA